MLVANDPMSLALCSGALAAAALMSVHRLRSGTLRAGFVAAAGTVGFTVGGFLNGLVIASALFVALSYPLFQRRFAREDDHFFLAPLIFWSFLAAASGILYAAGGEAARRTFGQAASFWDEEVKQLGEASKQLLQVTGQEAPLVLKWALAHTEAWLVATILAGQAVISYLSIRWVRGRLGWLDPIWGRILLFRIHERYSFLLIGVLILLVLAPYTSRFDLEVIALPALMLLGSGTLLSGITCSAFVVLAFRHQGRHRMAQAALFVMIVFIFAAWAAFLVVGLIDIWFDIRKLTLRKRETQT